MSGPVANVHEIDEGHTMRVVYDGIEVLLCKCNGEIFAVEDVCTHDGAPLDQGRLLGGCRIECPRHGAVFDVRTGEALKLPAVIPLPTFRVRVEGDDVFLEG